MPKSKRRKGGKKKAQQFGKQIKDQRVGKKIQEGRLMEKYMAEYEAEYTKGIQDELKRRQDERSKKINDEVQTTNTLDLGIMGSTDGLFDNVKTK